MLREKKILLQIHNKDMEIGELKNPRKVWKKSRPEHIFLFSNFRAVSRGLMIRTWGKVWPGGAWWKMCTFPFLFLSFFSAMVGYTTLTKHSKQYLWREMKPFWVCKNMRDTFLRLILKKYVGNWLYLCLWFWNRGLEYLLHTIWSTYNSTCCTQTCSAWHFPKTPIMLGVEENFIQRKSAFLLFCSNKKE